MPKQIIHQALSSKLGEVGIIVGWTQANHGANM